MAQPKLVNGATTYWLPHRQEYHAARSLRAADLVTLSGTVHRDFPAERSHTYRKMRLAWQSLSLTEVRQVITAWLMLRAGQVACTYTNPAGTEITVKLDTADPNLKTKIDEDSRAGNLTYSVSLTLAEV